MKSKVLAIFTSVLLLTAYSTITHAESNHHGGKESNHNYKESSHHNNYNDDDSYSDDHHMQMGGPVIPNMDNHPSFGNSEQVRERIDNYSRIGSRRDHRGHRSNNKHSLKALIHAKDVLELSEGQIKKLKKIKINTQKGIIKLEADRQILLIELKEQLHSDTPDRKKINEMIEQGGAISTDLRKLETNALLDGFELLDKKQIEKFKELKSHKGKKHGDDKKHHGKMKKGHH